VNSIILSRVPLLDIRRSFKGDRGIQTIRGVLGALNSTSIALIPKKNDLDSFDDNRLVSLCNSYI
jgi:hypothetical protein